MGKIVLEGQAAPSTPPAGQIVFYPKTDGLLYYKDDAGVERQFATLDNLNTFTTIDINGGTIDGTTIGGTTPAAGTFTTVSASGFVRSGGGTGTATLILDGAATFSRVLAGAVAGVNRWIMFMGNNTAESSGNAGSDFQLFAVSDAGAGIDSPLVITRAAGGNISLNRPVAVTGTLSVTGTSTFAAGTVALPSITTSGDTNTGVYFPAADTVGITAGGTQIGAFSSTGLAVTGTVSATNATIDGGAGSSLTIFRLGAVQSGNLISMRDATGTELLSVNGSITTLTTPSINIRSGFILNYLGTGYIRGASHLKIHDNHSGNIEMAVGGGVVLIGSPTPVSGAKLEVTGTLSATGVATFAAGTVALPSITTSGDTNTGIYFPAADTVGITAAGAEAIRIISSGSVGIGGSPTSKLDVIGNTGGTFFSARQTSANASVVSIQPYNASNGGVIYSNWATGSGTLDFGSGGSAVKMSLDNVGNLAVTGAVRASTGTVALPSITTSGDTNTGIYFPAADTVGITAGGTQRGEFSSTGLAVTGTLSATGNTTLSGLVGIGIAASSGYALRIGGAALSSTNQVALGITPTFTSAATSSVRGISQSLILADGAYTIGTIYHLLLALPSGGVGTTVTDEYGIAIGALNNGTTVYGVSSAVAAGATKWNLYVSGTAQNYFAGNVGIGVTAPAARFEVKQSGANWYDGVKIIRSTNNTQSLAFGNTSGASWIASVDSAGGSNNAMLFGRSTDGTTFTESMRIDSSGNVGIGTSTVTNKLQVVGGNASTLLLDNGGQQYTQLVFQRNATANTGGDILVDGTNALMSLRMLAVGALTFNTAATAGSAAERMRINSTGIVLIGTTATSGTNLLQVNSDALVNTLTVGRGGGNVATNTAVGASALVGTTTGTNNTAIGYQAAYTSTAQFSITAVGSQAAKFNTAIETTAFGAFALTNNTSGTNNTGIGYAAGGFGATTGTNATYIGNRAGYYANNIGSTAVGSLAMQGTGAGIGAGTGNYNTAIGHYALYSVTTGGSNSCLGYYSGSSITTGGNNVILGSYAGSTAPISSTGSNCIVFSDGAANVRQFYDGTNNAWVWNTGASERMRINSSGNVGIGTASPAQKLDVYGDAIFGTNGWIKLADTGTGNGNIKITATGSIDFGGSFLFRNLAGSSEYMRINSSGIVLIGTTSATGSNLLQVNSDIRVNGFTLGKGASSVATNTGFGLSVFSAITTGAQNTAFGYGALSTDTTGFGNAAFGLGALNFNNGGAYNTALGHSTLYYATTALQNTAVGHGCMSSGLTTGIFNTGVGYTALQMCTTGVATLGAITGGTGYTTGTYTGVVMTLSTGSAAATYPTATIVVAGGAVTTVTITSAGFRFVDTTTVLTAPAASIGGTGSGFSVPVATLIYGSGNTGVGHQASLFTTVGGGNTAIGYQAGRQNTTGNNNTSLGSGAGYSGVTAGQNTAIGVYALNLATGSNNVGLGYLSGYLLTTGSNNVIIGYYPGNTAPISSTGSNCIVFADGAGNLRQYYDGTNNAWAWNTGATERMRIDSAGNVGIGTASPSIVNPYASVVDIRGTTTDQNYGGSIRLASNNGTTTNSYLTVSTNGLSIYNTLAAPITFGTSNAEQMRIDSSGNVGIGTTSPSTYGKFSVTSASPAIYRFMHSGNSGSDTVTLSLGSNNVGYLSVAKITASQLGGVAGYALDISSTGTNASVSLSCSGTGSALIFNTAGTERFRVLATGNTGFGTNAPVSRLSVYNGGIHVRNDNSTIPVSQSYAIDFSEVQRTYGISTTAASPYACLNLYAGGDPVHLGGWAGAIRFFVGGANQLGVQRMGLYAAGTSARLGIDTTAPTNTLSFGGDEARTIWMERHTTADTAGNNLTVQAGGATVGATNKAGGSLILKTGTSTGSAGTAIVFQTAPTGTAGTTDNTIAEIGRFASTGNLLLRTTTDKVTQFGGAATGMTIASATYPVLALWDTADASYNFSLAQDGGTAYLVNFANGPMTFSTGGVEQVRITHTNSSTRYITLTGSNGANPTIGTSAGDLAISTGLAVTGALTISATTGVINFSGASYGQVAAVGDLYLDAGTAKYVYIRANGGTVGQFTAAGLAVTGALSSTGVLSSTAGISTTAVTTTATVITKVSDLASVAFRLASVFANAEDKQAIVFGAAGNISAAIIGRRDGAGWNTAIDFYTNNQTGGPNVDTIQKVGTFSSTGLAITGTLSTTGVATFPAGTVALPSITTTGDTNTGVYFPAADTVGITAAGTERMRIDSSGNVGIGTASPDASFKVTVSGNSGTVTPGIYFVDQASSPKNYVLYTNGTKDFVLRSQTDGINIWTANSTGLAVTGAISATSLIKTVFSPVVNGGLATVARLSQGGTGDGTGAMLLLGYSDVDASCAGISGFYSGGVNCVGIQTGAAGVTRTATFTPTGLAVTGAIGATVSSGYAYIAARASGDKLRITPSAAGSGATIDIVNAAENDYEPFSLFAETFGFNARTGVGTTANVVSITSTGLAVTGALSASGTISGSGGSLAGAGNGTFIASNLSTGRLLSGGGANVNAIHTYFDSTAYELSAGSTGAWTSGITVAARSYTGTGGEGVAVWQRGAEVARFSSTGLAVTGVLSSTSTITGSRVEVTGNTDVGTINFSVVAGGAFINTPSATTGYLAVAGSGIAAFSSTGLAVTGALSATNDISTVLAQNGATSLSVTNSTSGVNAAARALFVSDAGNGTIGAYSTTYNGVTGANDSTMINSNSQTNGIVNAIDGVLVTKTTGAGLAVSGVISATSTITGTTITGTTALGLGTANAEGRFVANGSGLDAVPAASRAFRVLNNAQTLVRFQVDEATGAASFGANLTVTGGTITTGAATALSLATSGGTVAKFLNVASPVNNLTFSASPTTGFPFIYADGTDTDVGMSFYSKGSGYFLFTTNVNGSAGTQVVIGHAANAVNRLELTGGATGNFPFIIAGGSDTNVGLGLSGKGTSPVNIYSASGTLTQVSITHTASANRYITLTGSNGGDPTIGTSAGSLVISSSLKVQNCIKIGEVSTSSNSGATYTINLNNGNVHNITLTNTCTFTFSNPYATGTAHSFTLFLRQDGTGGRTVTWPTTVRWAGGTAPTITSTLNKMDTFTFATVDGGTIWWGFTGGQNFSVT